MQRGRHVAHLVEEEGAAVGDLEQALLILDRAGEGAAHVAEQRALEQVVVEGGAVLHHERLLGARPVVVDGAGDELLAGAALAVDEHRRLAAHDLVEQLIDVLHRDRVADQLAEARVQLRLAPGPRRCRPRGSRRSRPRRLRSRCASMMSCAPSSMRSHRCSSSTGVMRGTAGSASSRLLPSPVGAGQLAHLAQEILLVGLARLLVQRSAGEEEADHAPLEQDRRGHHVEAEVALVHDHVAALGPAHAVAHQLDAVVAAAKALLREQRLAAELVVGRDDLAVCVVEHVAALVGERQLQPPPAANQVADRADDGKLVVLPQIDHERTIYHAVAQAGVSQWSPSRSARPSSASLSRCASSDRSASPYSAGFTSA